MAVSNAATTPSAANVLIDIRWVVKELLQDDMITQDNANLLTSAGRAKEQLAWHPLQIVAHYHLKNQKKIEQEMTLEVLGEWLAKKTGLPLFHIDPLKIDVARVTQTMSYAFAERHHVLAVQVLHDEIVLATDQPFYRDWEVGLSQTLRGKVFTMVVANPADIHRYRIEFYNLAKSVRGAVGGAAGQSLSGVTNFEQLLEIGELKSADANDQHIVNIVDWLLQYAFDQRASDIHLEPRREMGHVRFRIDSVLHDVYSLPAVVMAAVTSRIKILGRLNVAEKRRPQDGRLKTKSPNGSEVELRLSTLPTAFGEKMVMRIFDPEVLVRSYVDMGFSREEHELWQKMVKQPNGIVLVTGPTGSGKTTTLYSTLKHLATPECNVCSLEDPIEMIEPSFNQVQIQQSVDLDFAAGIRALMRQDPDIIMVGEIRDLETAQMAIQAALTGHLVISTLHTNDAPSAVTRLLDLGVPSYLLSSTILGIMAQRLVRTLCPHCKQEDRMGPEIWKMLTAPWKSATPKRVFRPKGCLECRDTGYMGRIGVYEIMTFTEQVKTLVNEHAGLQALTAQAYQDGMLPLRISGAQKVSQGITTLEEVLRLTPAIERFQAAPTAG
jgi:general secretion pathway protein E